MWVKREDSLTSVEHNTLAASSEKKFYFHENGIEKDDIKFGINLPKKDWHLFNDNKPNKYFIYRAKIVDSLNEEIEEVPIIKCNYYDAVKSPDQVH